MVVRIAPVEEADEPDINTEYVNDLPPFNDDLPREMAKIPEGHTPPGPEHDFSWAREIHTLPGRPREDLEAMLETEARNPKDIAATVRVPLHLLPTAGKIAQALAHLDGAEKYGVANWLEKPVEMMSYLSAIERHIERLKSGQDIDEKSKVPHFGHIMATCAILLDAQEACMLIDDRFTPTPPRGDIAQQMNAHKFNHRGGDMLDRAEEFLKERADG